MTSETGYLCRGSGVDSWQGGNVKSHLTVEFGWRSGQRTRFLLFTNLQGESRVNHTDGRYNIGLPKRKASHATFSCMPCFYSLSPTPFRIGKKEVNYIIM